MRIVEFLVKFVPQPDKLEKFALFTEKYNLTVNLLKQMKDISWKLSQKLSHDRLKKLSLSDLQEVETSLAIFRLMTAAENSWNELYTDQVIARLNLVL